MSPKLESGLRKGGLISLGNPVFTTCFIWSQPCLQSEPWARGPPAVSKSLQAHGLGQTQSLQSCRVSVAPGPAHTSHRSDW